MDHDETGDMKSLNSDEISRLQEIKRSLDFQCLPPSPLPEETQIASLEVVAIQYNADSSQNPPQHSSFLLDL